MTRLLIALALPTIVAGCVAPEPPAARPYVAPVSAAAPPSGNFEAAPTPNRAVRAPNGEQLIRVQQ